jgi:hypothetical protein
MVVTPERGSGRARPLLTNRRRHQGLVAGRKQTGRGRPSRVSTPVAHVQRAENCVIAELVADHRLRTGTIEGPIVGFVLFFLLHECLGVSHPGLWQHRT